ncbi:MAG: PIN domain nuclease [Balneolaceae bacterium]|nr:MAG: PIN domain nuclease [Balneolaceae bacterium]
MILVDTSVWIDYYNGVESWQCDMLDKALSEEQIITGDIILAEILQGFEKEPDFIKARQAMDHLVCIQLGGKELAIQAAINFRFLRSKGVTIRKTIDMLIGTWCIESGAGLLHNDKDFDRMSRYLPLRTISADNTYGR